MNPDIRYVVTVGALYLVRGGCLGGFDRAHKFFNPAEARELIALLSTCGGRFAAKLATATIMAWDWRACTLTPVAA